MKVLFLANIPAPYSVDFFNELGKSCDLTVLYERRRATDRDEKWSREISLNKTYQDVFLKGINLISDGAFCPEVTKYLKDKTYDIIVLGSYYTPTEMFAIQYLKLLGIPFIIKADGGYVKNDSHIKKQIKKYFIGAASAWLSSGELTKEYLISYGAETESIYWYPFTSLKEKDVFTKPLNETGKQIIKNKLNIPERKVVISVGRFVHGKGHELLINAFRDICDDVGLYIIGGIPTQEYENIKKHFGLTNVHFVGFKTKEELNEYYKIADIFALATREDVWGLVINEAMCHRLPIISSNKCVAALELVQNGVNGFIVDNEDVDGFQEKIKTVLNNNELLKSMSIKSYEIIKPYTIENMAAYYNDAFEKVIEKRN